jgi:hypothetical protein
MITFRRPDQALQKFSLGAYWNLATQCDEAAIGFTISSCKQEHQYIIHMVD